MEPEKENHLLRKIGVFGLASSVINNVIGGGIFVLPALIAGILGNASIIAYLVCSAFIILVMLCFAEIGCKVSNTGGAYAYISSAFGPLAGFVSNAMFLYGFGIVSDAALANIILDMLKTPFPIFLKPEFRILFFIVLFGSLAFINVRGVKQGITLIKINTILKLIPLFLIIFVGVWHINSSNLEWTGFPALKTLGEASILLFFAFGGAESSLNVSGEISKPKRTVPLGILIGISTVVIIYILLQIVSQGVLGPELILNKETPLAGVAQKILGYTGWTILITGATISIFGCISGSIISFPRLLFASAEEGMAPAIFSRIHPKFSTPYLAIICYALLDFTLSVLGGFSQLAILSSAILLCIYGGVISAAIKYRLKRPGSDSFKLPGGITIHIITLLGIIWFLTKLSMKEVIAISVFIGILVCIYYIILFVKKRALRISLN